MSNQASRQPSRQYCYFHPLEPALWYHPNTHVLFCERCVDHEETGGGLAQARCFLTGDELTYLGGANTAQPFWQRTGDFFRYPLKPDSLLMMAIFTLIAWALFGLASGGGLVFMAIGAVMLLSLMTRYGLMIIEHSAEGRFDPPTLNETFAGSGFDMLFKQVAVQAIFFAGLIAIELVQIGWLTLLAQALVILILPASVMILALEKSISMAVSPSSIWHLIRSVGWAYLLFYGFLVLIWGAFMTVSQALVKDIPASYILPLILLAIQYFSMMSYHLMGYVLFQYQADIGFVAEDQLAREKRRQVWESVDLKTEVLVKSGQYQQAINALTKYLRQHPNSLRHHDQLSKLYAATGQTEAALVHGEHLLTVVQGLGDDARLYFFWQHLCSLKPDFTPQDPAVRYHLAQQLSQRGKYQAACRLLSNLHKDAPHFEYLPDAYHLMAQMLLEGLNHPAKARSYLQFVQQQFPEYAHSEQVVALLQAS